MGGFITQDVLFLFSAFLAPLAALLVIILIGIQRSDRFETYGLVIGIQPLQCGLLVFCPQLPALGLQQTDTLLFPRPFFSTGFRQQIGEPRVLLDALQMARAHRVHDSRLQPARTVRYRAYRSPG